MNGKSAGKGVSKQVPHVATQEFSANLIMVASFTSYFEGKKKGKVKDLFLYDQSSVEPNLAPGHLAKACQSPCEC